MPWKSALLLVLLVQGCRHAPAEEGASSFAVVEPPRPAAPSSQRSSGEPRPSKCWEDFRQAVPVKATVELPVYPPRALKAKAGRATVGVQVTVDANGDVTDIGSSLLTISTPGPFAEDFREAVKAAVRQWRFRSAEILQMETVTSGDFSYQRVAHRTRTETKFDLAFMFTAGGKVEAGE